MNPLSSLIAVLVVVPTLTVGTMSVWLETVLSDSDCRKPDVGILANRRQGFQRYLTPLNRPFIVLLKQ